jgi:hypothetical protein
MNSNHDKLFGDAFGPKSEIEVDLSFTTHRLFDLEDIYMVLEKKKSTSSLVEIVGGEFGAQVNYDEAFIPGGKDGNLSTAIFLASDILEFEIGEGLVNEPSKKIIRKKNGRSPKKTSLFCLNCQCTETTLWRRISGELMCNPCALYYKLHGSRRPKQLIKSEIKRRRRKTSKIEK